MAERAVPPWEDYPVFTIQPRADWQFWLTGLNSEGWADIAGRVPPGDMDAPSVVDAVRAVDQRAVGEEQAWAAGIWFPESNGRRPTASLLLRTYGGRGDARKAARRFAKDVRRAPRLPGLDVHGYTLETTEVEDGPVVVQYIDSSDEGGVMLHTCRITLFPHLKDEVVVIDCDTPYTALLDAVDDELVDLLAETVYVLEDPA
jgi:hypothetical protein